MTILTDGQAKLRTYVDELAADRGMSPAAVLRALRAGHDPDVPGGGAAELADRWGVTPWQLEQLQAELDAEPVPVRPRPAPGDWLPLGTRVVPASQASAGEDLDCGNPDCPHGPDHCIDQHRSRS